jgi:cytochrome c553
MRQIRVGKLLVVIMGGLAAMGAGLVSIRPGDSGVADRSVDFSRDIAPILSDRCFKCHGPDEAAREQTGGLRLDSFEGATAILEDGGQAIVPGDPARSLVMQRLRAGSERHRMPPADSNLTISEDEIALIERWIAGGGEYTKHWAFVPPVKAEVPRVEGQAWCRNEIDRFVLGELERRGIEPSPEADRATLIRRVYLDVTGLPPTPEQIDAFVGDTGADAYERVVDGLLASEHYGERMALMWLDVARYADTNGYHHDNERSQWPWRDWVIEAFNDNKPFDAFVVEQIGGDEIPEATLEERIATGFNRNHPMTDEGGAIDEEYRVEYAADRVETMSNAFLALTMNCTRCHDHKFDPLTQDDYFSLFAFFNSTTEKGLYDRAQGDRDKAFPPFLKAPTDEQLEALNEVEADIADLAARMEGPLDGLDDQQAVWEKTLRAEHAVSWSKAKVTQATSTGGATLEVLDDGSVLVTGENPETDVHELTIHTDGSSLNLIVVEVLPDERMFEGRVGRAPNGNAVLSGIEVEAVSATDPTQTQAVQFAYAWADIEQANGDFDVINALRADDPLGWAVAGHQGDGPRVAIFFSNEPFGFIGGTDLRVRLRYETQYAQHVFGRVRVLAGSAQSVRKVLPVVERDWFIAAPFEAATGDEAFETAYGPESITRLDLSQGFGEGGKIRWVHRPDVVNGQSVALDGERRAFYLARTYFSSQPRQIELSLGSDDAIRVFLGGVELLANNARRGVAPDQEKLTVDLPAGESVVVVKIVNDGGPGGVYAQRLDELPLHVAPVALLDAADRTEAHASALRQGYRERLSPAYRALREELARAQTEQADIESMIPNVMVMDELPEPRATFVLSRGQYDLLDESRPVERTTPRVLNSWPESAPHNRYGLGLWLVSEDNPLTARVAVNRFWQTVFGLGLVKTADDFGMQGDWPSHPALLDWLAVDFREHGWDVKRLVRQMVTSSTYRQSSVVRADLAELDPENRLLARASRRRLPAELVRDNALAAAGLLNDKVGGASVRPYQPAGLWEERSMPVSNTRIFERDTGDKLYRRGMYTFWKRSAPPPQMANFDAPTREYCVALRSVTNTPVQALTLMNDETYLEIARVLAARVWSEVQGDGALDERLGRMFRLATGRSPETDELEVLRSSYEFALERYEQAPEDAQALLSYGEIERNMEINVAEHAALTVVANIVLNLDETVTRE